MVSVSCHSAERQGKCKVSEVKLTQSIIEEQKESFIMFPKVLLNENDYEGKDLDIFHLAIMKSLVNNLTNSAMMSINDLMHVRGVNHKNKQASQAIRNSILRLQDINYINIYEDSQKTKKVVKVKPAQTYFIEPSYRNEEVFIKVFEYDIKKIITIQSNYKPKLFLIYLAIISHLYYHKNKTMEHKAVWATIETIAKITQLERKTVMKYIKQLHENEVLFAITTRVKTDKNKNFYGRYKHKDLIIREALEKTETLKNYESKAFMGTEE